MMASSTYVAADEYVDRAIHLDAEMLAEAGIKERYEELLPTLRKYVKNPTQIEERLGAYSDSYAVQAGGREQVVYDKVPDDLFLLWSRATFVFFDKSEGRFRSSLLTTRPVHEV